MFLYLKIEYKQIVVHIKTIATAKFLREGALPTENTLKPTKQALKFFNLEAVGIETKKKVQVTSRTFLEIKNSKCAMYLS